MPSDILTSQNLARHLKIKAQHDYWEKQFHTSRDRLLLALQDFRTWSQDGYIAMVKEYERKVFQQKLFALDHPDLHEEFLKLIPVRQLIVQAPELPPDAVTDHDTPTEQPKGYVQTLIEKHLPPVDRLPSIPGVHSALAGRPRRDLKRVIADLMGPDEELLDKD